MRETVLLFGIRDEKRMADLKRTLLPLRLRMKVIDPEEYLQPVGYLAGVKEVEAVQETYQGTELGQEMLVMASMESGRVDQLLNAMRRSGLPRINYKAVLTQTNQYWNALTLYEELKKEHEYMNKPSMPVQP